MDRQIVYEDAIPLDTDFLLAQKNAMLGLALLSRSVFGTATTVEGLDCSPTSPGSLSVDIGQGAIYTQDTINSVAYGNVGTDASASVMKQGISLEAVNLACAAPGTVGQSINYLIEAAFQEADEGSATLPYYNSADPTVPFNGPANSGTSQNTVRRGKILLHAKAGVAATTGTQTTPAADAGYVSLWVVTVANGQTSIGSGDIAAASGSPRLTGHLADMLTQALADGRYLRKSNNLSDLSSLSTALGNLGFASGTNWTQLPDGKIFQWGQSSSNNSPTFPLTFPTACFIVMAICLNTNTGGPDVVEYASKSTTGFTVVTSRADTNTTYGTGTFLWFAIGN